MSRPVVLLTGWTGQLGHHLRLQLEPLGHLVLADLVPGDMPQDQHSVQFYPLDLADPVAVRRLVQQVKPDIIVNPAAYTAVDRAEEERELAFRVNGRGPGVLAEEARVLGCPLIHYSTDYVFDGSGTRPWREEDPTSPINAYGASKLEGERALLAAGGTHFIFRTSWMISSHGNNFVKTMLGLGLEREELGVIADQHGAPASAADLARWTADLVRALFDRGPDWAREQSGIYHLTNSGETTWHGLADETFRLARALGWPLRLQHLKAIPTSEFPTPARRPANSRLDCAKVCGTFGWSLRSWQEGVRDILAELREQGWAWPASG